MLYRFQHKETHQPNATIITHFFVCAACNTRHLWNDWISE